MLDLQALDRLLPFAVLLLPLAGFLVLALFGDWIKKDGDERGAAYLACATVIIAFALALWATGRLYGYLASPEGLRFAQPTLGTSDTWSLRSLRESVQIPAAERLPIPWIAVGGLEIPFGLLLDPLSCVMMLVVTGIGSLIHVYSVGYMAHDEDRVRFFSYLNLFTFFMLLLVLGGSLPLVFVGWEGVGLCSYLLIGFWYRKESASAAGLKAFLVNRIGDMGLILGMVFAFHAFGTLDLTDIADNAGALAAEPLLRFGPVTIAALLLFLGAVGKSAQIPLHVWLPDAMEGPTPVSALIHAATMVTAGVYLVARLAPLYSRSATAMLVVAVTGALTALVAGTIAVVQTDIKRVLAYSTVSQLGFMFLAAGVGAFSVAVFHLYTHAFFKALLFLGSGSVIHAMSGEQDMSRMGGLWRKIPWTFGTFLVGVLAISGIPPFAGYFSKDEILAAAAGHRVLFALAVVAAFLTAAYMARLVFLTFFGRFRGGEEAAHHLHESPPSMLVPLVLLATGSVVAGFPLFASPLAGITRHVRIPDVVQPALRLPEPHLSQNPWLPFGATAVAVLGILASWYLYQAMPEWRARLAGPLRPLLALFRARYFFDRVYDGFVRHVIVAGSEGLVWRRLDAGLIDGAVNRAGRATAALADRLRPVETGFVRHYALVLLAGAVALVSYLLWS